MAYIRDGMIILEERKAEDFQSANCEGCMCFECNNKCKNCYRCFRTAAAVPELRDYYCSDECDEADRREE